ncbi:hypothetical protein [Rhodococcus sp. ACS1]|uniref:hypothetical protein n=1 Tax=Rhodococcus sp. ACS1 TaxID=2028570 RepID=UPI0015CEC260|nr:hypothetical protein [Rhodococcus sp. ACS1]
MRVHNKVSLAKPARPAGVSLAKKKQIIPDSWALMLSENILVDFQQFLMMRPA